jgi:hypothetical protein
MIDRDNLIALAHALVFVAVLWLWGCGKVSLSHRYPDVSCPCPESTAYYDVFVGGENYYGVCHSDKGVLTEVKCYAKEDNE